MTRIGVHHGIKTGNKSRKVNSHAAIEGGRGPCRKRRRLCAR